MKKHVLIFVLIIPVFLFFMYGEPQPHPKIAEIDEIKNMVNSMSLEEKIGQLLMLNLPDAEITDETVLWLNKFHIGGVFILRRNVQLEQQVRAFIKDLRDKVVGPSGLPLFIAADQEGGPIWVFPFLQELTGQKDIKTAKQAYEVAKRRGEELKNLGVNVVFAPVLDITKNQSEFIYARTFNGNAKAVSSFGASMVKGYKDAGIIPVIKHFPGHGGTVIDSHKDLPTIFAKKAQWFDNILPFRMAIRAGAEMIMTAHIRVKNIDKKNPATLSKKIVTDFLRKSMKFSGVVITDELSMGAIADTYGLAEASKLALLAGNDILLMRSSLAEYEKVFNAVKTAVEKGEISKKRIDESVERIVRLKLEVR